MALSPGTRLDSYEILSLLGSGGMGEVYKARELKLGRDVAIKLIRSELASDPERLKRFEQEARSASTLDHPNIITIHDFGEAGGRYLMVMQYVPGKTLRELMETGRLGLKHTIRYAARSRMGLRGPIGTASCIGT